VDAGEAARAPFANSIVCSIGPALTGLAAAVTDRGVSVPARTIPPPTRVEGQMTGDEMLDIIAAHTPDSATYVNEVTSMSDAFMSRVPITRPDGYKLCASGGLGFGMAAAVGVAMARPDDVVVAAIGDGSANYAIQALYTAATHQSRVVFVIFNNGKYGAVVHFAEAMGAPDAPGLELPGIDFLGLAKGYGVPASSVSNVQDFEKEYTKALNATGPVLIEAKIAFT
jgi:benzoylformate decarboxylase